MMDALDYISKVADEIMERNPQMKLKDVIKEAIKMLEGDMKNANERISEKSYANKR